MISFRSLALFFAALPFLTACDGSGAQAGSNNAQAKPEARFAQDFYTPASLGDFAGSWEVVSDDGTTRETADLEVTDGSVIGILRTIEHGYFSGKDKVTAQVELRGALKDGVLDVRVWDADAASEQNAVNGRAMRRGNYLILRIADSETAYARPGVSIVESAEGSAAGESLLNLIAGRIYSTSSQAAGRGAFVGSRVKLALCSDGTISFDVSNLATSGGNDGVDMGSSMSRRGEWSVVLLAGVPAVRASWNGTGSSYSLTRYFRIKPSEDGLSALIDGTDLPVTGSC